MNKKMSVEEVKAFFRSMECSTYVMSRENPQKYNEYLLADVSKQTEILWKEERLLECFEEIKQRTIKAENWLVFNKMYDLVISIKNDRSINIMLDSLKILFDDLKENERIIISETIIGRMHRSQRSGLIYLSYDMGLKSYSELFAVISLKLLDIRTDDMKLITRTNNAKRNFDEIIQELGINPNAK
ncbi:hypothetical protein [Cohnella panacarvi]|uniref:hypothetical protein n=1 Tax=Cohnella panacarvi TaxID=400776 RepID=UPI00047B8A7E|nr:hypothetical protein [Cohnella panacarvi]